MLNVDRRPHPSSQADDALVESEERLRLATDAAHMGSWSWDIPSGAVVLSEKIREMHGLTAETRVETYGDYLQCIFPADRERFALAIARAIQDRSDLDVEYRVSLPEGGVRWVLGKGSVRFDGAGTALRVIGMGMEITERKRAEQATELLARSSELLGASLDFETVLHGLARACVPALADWCAVDRVDRDGSIARLIVTHADPAKAETARRLRDMVPSTERSAPLVEVLRTGQSILQPDLTDAILELAATNDEHLRIMRELGFSSVMLVPLITHGNTLGVLTLVAGESGRRYDAADLALAENIARRASMAIDHARAYGDAQRTAQDLRRSNVAKDEFLGLVSHELRTPLTAILGNAQVLTRVGEDIEPEDRKQAHADVLSYAERLQTIIENLLMLARMDPGTPVPTEPVSIQRLAERVADEHGGVAVDVEGGVPPVRGRPVCIEQILVNLVSNAKKYSAAGAPIDVSITATPEDEVIVRVLDRGAGIDEGEARRLFSPFYRSPRTATQAPGAGIGLTLCKRLVELQGGRIWAKPREGGGAEFSFTLPVYHPEN